jgi:hypothetical protein
MKKPPALPVTPPEFRRVSQSELDRLYDKARANTRSFSAWMKTKKCGSSGN